MFKDLHSALFFDLKDQRNDTINGAHKLKFSYTLDGAPTAYVWKAVILYERQITSEPISGSVKLTFSKDKTKNKKRQSINNFSKKNFLLFFTLKALVHAQ